MSKAKKSAYADKEKAATVTAAAQKLVPLGESSAAPAAKKKAGKKPSRGK